MEGVCLWTELVKGRGRLGCGERLLMRFGLCRSTCWYWCERLKLLDGGLGGDIELYLLCSTTGSKCLLFEKMKCKGNQSDGGRCFLS